MPPELIILFVIACILASVVSTIWFFKRSHVVLEQWADEHGFTIISAERRWFRRGPFWWRTSKAQDVYFVTVKTDKGITQRGFVRCGSYWSECFPTP